MPVQSKPAAPVGEDLLQACSVPAPAPNVPVWIKRQDRMVPSVQLLPKRTLHNSARQQPKPLRQRPPVWVHQAPPTAGFGDTKPKPEHARQRCCKRGPMPVGLGCRSASRSAIGLQFHRLRTGFLPHVVRLLDVRCKPIESRRRHVAVQWSMFVCKADATALPAQHLAATSARGPHT